MKEIFRFFHKCFFALQKFKSFFILSIFFDALLQGIKLIEPWILASMLDSLYKNSNIEVCNAMSIANIAAGIQVMKTGAAVITWQEVYEELIQLSEKNANRKILQVSDLSSLRELYSTKKIVFTNGCFDLLHIGHIHCLLSASNYGDILVVGINSDSSIKRIKGEERPVIPQNERVEILSALECVDYVILYEEDTP